MSLHPTASGPMSLRFVPWLLLPLASCGGGGAGGTIGSVATPVVVDVGGKEAAWALTSLDSGKMLIAGDTIGQLDRALVGRFKADATVDATFGTQGFTVSDLPAFGLATASRAYALAVQPADGKIVVAGHSWAVGHDSRMMVARYSRGGVLDATFGRGGYVEFDANPDVPFPGRASGDDAYAVAVQGDGKIVVGGSAAISHADNGSGQYWSDFALVRLESDGRFDAGFGTGGVVINKFGSSAFIHAIALQGDGKIVAGGFAAPPSGQYDLALVRYQGDGSLDAGFGQGGVSVTDLGGDDRVYGLALLGDGRLVAGGQTSVGGVSRFAIARFHGDGSLDKSFAGVGWTSTAAPAGKAAGLGLAVGKDRYYVGGWAVGGEGNYDFAIARYTTAGLLDECNRQPGLAVLPTAPGVDDQAFAIALQADGTPVLAGYSDTDVAVRQVKLLACPGPDDHEGCDDDHHHHGDDDHHHHGKCGDKKKCDHRGDDDHDDDHRDRGEKPRPGKNHGRD